MIAEVRAAMSGAAPSGPQQGAFAKVLAETGGTGARVGAETALKLPTAQGVTPSPAASGQGLPAMQPAAAAHTPQSTFGTWAANAAQRVQASSERLDVLVKHARAGRSFSPAQLLGMQFEAYQASQTLDFAGKVLEKATSGVKQVLQTQV